MNKTKFAIRVLLHDQTIGYHPILAVIGGGAAEGVLLRQFLHWDGVMSNSRGDDWDGWFWKTAKEIYAETGMRRSEFETARTNLIKRGLVEYESRGVPNRAHYRVNLDNIEDALASSEDFQKQYARSLPKQEEQASDEAQEGLQNDTDDTNLLAENRRTSLPKTDKLVRRKPTNLLAENAQTIHKSTTSDYQKRTMIPDDPVPRSEMQSLLRSLFTIPLESDWQWLDALLLKVDDLEFMTKVAHNMRGVVGDHFDALTFSRMVMIQKAKIAMKPGALRAEMTT